MRLYRNVNISFQVGCEVDDETAKKLIEKSHDIEAEDSLKAVFELLRLTDKPLDNKMQFVYDEINDSFPSIYIPDRDYKTDNHLEDEEGNIISYAN